MIFTCYGHSLIATSSSVLHPFRRAQIPHLSKDQRPKRSLQKPVLARSCDLHCNHWTIIDIQVNSNICTPWLSMTVNYISIIELLPAIFSALNAPLWFGSSSPWPGGLRSARPRDLQRAAAQRKWLLGVKSPSESGDFTMKNGDFW